MTREEAIRRIKQHRDIHKLYESRAVKISEALDMAIKALEQEPCEDAVSRAFMYELGATCIAKPDGNGNLIALGRIDMLPPAQPQYEELTPEEAASEIASGSMMSARYWLDAMIRLEQMGYVICRKR